MNKQPDTILNSPKILLGNVKQILKHQEEIKKLKGEQFNVFSILNMESKENGTHSAFLGELLNPKGSHGNGNIFLRLFLEVIGNNCINSETARLVLEKSIGKRDDKNKTGGRVDIYIIDNEGQSICIENKINALDQYFQIERYVNHNKKKNEVYYLTLDGCDASKESKGKLEEGIDYYCISYHHTIIDWLSRCLKESTEQPILRETVKQYIILIKKLTNQLSNTAMEKEIEALIKNNYKAAKTIASSIGDVELSATTSFLKEMKAYLGKQLDNNWTVQMDEDLNQTWTGLEIVHITWGRGIAITLEGQSKVPWNESVYGIKAHNKIWDRNDIKSKIASIDELQYGFRESEYWVCYQTILKFNLPSERQKLFDNELREVLKIEVANKLLSLAKECELFLADIKQI